MYIVDKQGPVYNPQLQVNKLILVYSIPEFIFSIF